MTYFADCCCSECGIAYQVPENYRNKRREDGKTFYCPNGHAQCFRESTADKLRRELNNAKQQIARAEDEARIAREDAERETRKRKRVEKRVHNGVCPCCNRTFANVAKHMKTKHPNVTPLKVSA